MKIIQRQFKIELELIDKAFPDEHLYTAKEIRKLIKNRLPFTLEIKNLKIRKIKGE